MCVIRFEWYWGVLLDFLKFYHITCFQLHIALSRDPLFASMYFPEGIPSSSEWFILLGTRYLLYNGSLRTVNMKWIGFVYKEKKGYGVRASERWWKGKETFCTIFKPVRLSVPLRCQSSFFAFSEISIRSHVPLVPCRLHL